ncbi:hypothetical protein PTSG_09242 [Salpingoeca rosetta]|uniref:DH domain-containing protein n=1 Tax=Salpingoeca rosetta (strain ATCC 50818 / BSB-021) TaxID=946362 RepID=F2UN51_SALR5|nr:uncharacterized protein PTSG_09242 [Salpingoeca rosetta]EGD78550.1 hypothetical protein PTSG_09242 [Salpingoeca rosetta]|eukprot:XP_004989499.1 hypothetical protein PTSG_09242 [Salpingoeca rosetta]
MADNEEAASAAATSPTNEETTQQKKKQSKAASKAGSKAASRAASAKPKSPGDDGKEAKEKQAEPAATEGQSAADQAEAQGQDQQQQQGQEKGAEAPATAEGEAAEATTGDAATDDAASSSQPQEQGQRVTSAGAGAGTGTPTVATLYADGGLPEGALGMFLTGATQEIFGCIADENVTAEKPTFLIPIEKIKEDFLNRAAVSDFSVCKEQIQAYDGEELLVVYDPDFTFETNFIVCLTEQAKGDYYQRVAAVVQKAEEERKKKQAGGDGGEEWSEDMEGVPMPTKKKRRPPAPWVSLGSEHEVDDAKCTPSRPPICLLVSRKRRLFGAPRTFHDAIFDSEHEFPPNTEYKSQPPIEDAPPPLHRRLMDAGAQAIPDTAHTTTQTTWYAHRNASTQWRPRTTADAAAGPDGADDDGIPRTDDDYRQMAKAIETAYGRIRPFLLQNSVINVHVDDFLHLRGDKLVALGTKADSALKEFQSFKFMNFGNSRVVSSVDWHPTESGVIAVAYSKPVTLQERVTSEKPNEKSRILVWGLSDPIQPKIILEAPDDVLSVKFCPTHPNIVVAGCFNGQLAVFDLGKQGRRLNSGSVRSSDSSGSQEIVLRHVALSEIDDGHRAPITDVQWLPHVCDVSASGAMTQEDMPPAHTYQLMSCAADGTCLIWDVRGEDKLPSINLKALDLVWKPLVKVYLSSDAAGEVMASKFALYTTHRDFVAERAPDLSMTTELCVATEQGQLHFLDWRRPETDSGKLGVQQIRTTVDAHGGACTSVARSPFFPALLLSVGGSSISLWHDKSSTPILTHRLPCMARPVAGCWSLHRPGVFFIARADGSVDVWDFLDTSYKPSLTQSICAPTSLTTLAAGEISTSSSRGRLFFLAAGDVNGSTHIIDLPKTLIHPVANERVLRYPLLLKELVKLTAAEDPRLEALQSALSTTQDVAKHVNECKHDIENYAIVQRLEHTLKDYVVGTSGCVPLVDHGRLLIDGDVKLRLESDGRAARRYIFLFQRVMLVVQVLSSLRATNDDDSEGQGGAGGVGATMQAGGDVTLVVPGGDAAADHKRELRAVYEEFKKTEKDFLVQVGLRTEGDEEEDMA